MARRLLLLLLAVALAGTACTSRRVLRLENSVLRAENERLIARNQQLEVAAPDPREFAREVDLATVAGWLDRAGFVHEWANNDQVLRLEYAGANTTFGVSIQHFQKAEVLFLATHDYLRLDDVPDSRGVVLLLVKLAALNYEMVVGKLQLDPATGDILLSTELHLGDGLGYDTFVDALDRLIKAADTRWVELSQAAGGDSL